MLFDLSLLLDNKNKADIPEDLFADIKRKGWKKLHVAEARCDFSPNNLRMNARGVLFLSVWKASVYGMTLSDIKADASMPEFFAKNISDFLARFFNISTFSTQHLDAWNIITPPPRRHLENNFAVTTAKIISEMTGIKFSPDTSKAKNRQRVMAEFELVNIPKADNIICFDDIVTSGSTFQAMRRLLSPLNKNVVFVAGINNKL